MSGMRNIKLVLEYDGTNYAGFQWQKKHVSIQQALEEKLAQITKEKIRIICSGRTDAGVHALGQVVNFQTTSRIPTQAFVLALNRVHPKDIVVISAKELPQNFHARFSAKKKTYRYIIYNALLPSPFFINRAAWIKQPLDIKSMQAGVKYFTGRHDFTAFEKSGSPRNTSVCEVYKAEVRRKNKNVIEITICANRFLYGMVRAMAGFLINTGRKKRKPEEIKKALLSGDKKNLPVPAPACGLYLVKVVY